MWLLSEQCDKGRIFKYYLNLTCQNLEGSTFFQRYGSKLRH